MDGWGIKSGLDGPAHGDGPPGWSGRREDLDVLCSAPLLNGLDPQDVAALLPAFRTATVNVDQELIIQGESGAAQLFIVLNGRFAVLRRHRGERVVTAVLGPGDSVGELNVFDPGRDTSTVRALTAARVAVLGGQDLLEWATTRPHAAARLLHVLARRLHRTDAAVRSVLMWWMRTLRDKPVRGACAAYQSRARWSGTRSSSVRWPPGNCATACCKISLG